jgi:hypothetical protein
LQSGTARLAGFNYGTVFTWFRAVVKRPVTQLPDDLGIFGGVRSAVGRQYFKIRRNNDQAPLKGFDRLQEIFDFLFRSHVPSSSNAERHRHVFGPGRGVGITAIYGTIDPFSPSWPGDEK